MTMIGLVLVAHAGIAQEFLGAAEMIMGKIEGVEAVSIKPDDQVDLIRNAIAGAIKKVDSDGVIIMTDMFGGTPSNMSLSFLQENHIEVLTGVNLPMMIKFVADRAKFGVAELAEKLKQCGRESIIVAGEYLKK
jgi:PTS system mannose-specific IIA component